jgi:spermidine synthase
MNETSGPAAGASSPARAEVLLPLVALLFAGSGASALIYENVWYQLLQLAIGSTAVSLGVLLATFMGGLCIGSLALPRIVKGTASFWFHPFRTYAAIELLIGVLGLVELPLIPFVGQAYLTGPQAGFAGMLLRSLAAAICLLPPTILMGASLPAMARWIEASPRGVSWWGLLYGANIFGAVCGCLIAGFYLLRLFDVNIATFAAVAINLSIAGGSFLLAARTPPRLAPEDRAAPEIAPSGNDIGWRWTIYAAIALSGASALAAEVVWTRLMGLMLGATVYAFSIILAVFLVGLAIGTAAASGMVRGLNPRLALGWSQMFAAAGIAWAAYAIADALPYWPINPQLSKDPVFTFQIDMARTIWAILPATLFWGASFPFAFGAAAASRGRDSAATVGGVYAANTAGAIFGALMASLVLIPSIGTQNTQRILLIISALSGLIVLIPLMRVARTQALELSAGVAVGLVALSVWGVHKVPDELIAFGRRMGINTGMSKILYTAEGRNSSIAVSQWNDGALQFHVAGKVEASTEIYDMKLQRMLGHLPGLIHPNPRSVLVVGFGGGITAGTFTTYPSVQRIVICELEPLIPPVSTRYFAQQNYGVMNDKRVLLVYDDARHFVAATTEKFDIITSDPIHPFVKGSATLYSKEYFELVKSHLNPGGIVTQWVPLYESDAATVKSEIATFFAVFPYATVWANNINGQGYDIVLVGQLQPPSFNLDELQARLDRRDYAPVAKSLANVDLGSVSDLFSTYAGNSAGLKPWLKDAAINHDADLRLQYLAGLALNHAEEDSIYRQIMQYWGPPVELFTGSPQRLDTLFSAMVTKPQGQESGPVKNPAATAKPIAD